MRATVALLAAAVVAGAGAGCGDKQPPRKGTAQPGGRGVTDCSGTALSKAPLPRDFPAPKGVTLTKTEMLGPTTILDGYFDGTIREAHDAYKSSFMNAGYTILFDEVEEHDSEVSWKGEGRSGQVAVRDVCSQKGRIAVHITNRPTGT